MTAGRYRQRAARGGGFTPLERAGGFRGVRRSTPLRDDDMGGGATFYDVLVDVAPAEPLASAPVEPLA